jgi:dethiobiotin synthetase
LTALRLVLVGTGTGVGKTHVGCALIEAGEALGIEAVGLKPIETGEPSTAPSDQDRLEEVVRGFHVKRGSSPTFHVKQSPYRFTDPVSPHLAARRVGVRIDLCSRRELGP